MSEATKRTRMDRGFALAVTFAAVWLGGYGCGPIEYLATVPGDAAGAIAEAKHVNGEKYAPYEMTCANEYVHQSRVLAGYARFHSSVGFGQKAAKNAREAKRIALEKAAMPEEKADPNGGSTQHVGDSQNDAKEVHTDSANGVHVEPAATESPSR